jgi:alkylation response protein AidB-like acyl-CoA dehydrogenase
MRAEVDTDLTPEESSLRDLVRDFAEGEVAPNAQRWWDEGRCPVELFLQMGRLGLMGLLVPEEFEGTPLSTVGLVAAMEELGQVDQSVAAAWQAHLTIGTLPLLHFGSTPLKDRYLVPIARGECLAGFGLTEPDAGSDASRISTKASKTADGWRISGQKAFISNVGTDISYGVALLARCDVGFASFVVPRGAAGFSLGDKVRGIGWRSLDTRPLFFDDVLVDDEHLIGSAGQGLRQFLSVLDVGRITIAALSVSLATAMLKRSLEYAHARVQFGSPLANFQAIQFKLADMATELEAARLMTYSAAKRRDLGRPFHKEAAMAKLKASRVAVAAASEAVQIHGGYGYTMESGIARFYCDAKVLEIGEGTNEIQHLVIARELGC